MSLFDIGEIGQDITTPFLPEKDKSSKKNSSKVEGKKLLRKENAAKILEQIGGIPKPSESFDVLSNGQSNAGGFYEAIRNQWEKDPGSILVIKRPYRHGGDIVQRFKRLVLFSFPGFNKIDICFIR